MKIRSKAARCATIATLYVLAASGCQSTGSTQASAPADPPAATARPDAPIEPKAPAPVATLRPVYFDTDSWELRDDTRRALRANAEVIQQHQDWGVLTIEGHCDERGSDEYNIALGDRRALVVKRYLEDLGVPASRLRTVSFGENRPAVQGHDESAWRYNRRSELKTKVLRAASR